MGRAVKGFLAVYIVLIYVQNSPAKHNADLINKISDAKDFKKYVRTHTNVFTIFSKSAKDFTSHDIFKEVALEVKGIASVVHVDCSIDRKTCKKLKSSPSPVEYKHFKDGEYHKVYDRKLTTKSIVKFLQNPTGDISWDEEASAVDVVHVERRSDLVKLIAKEKKPMLLMFYAPWCGHCKKLKPEFAAAASALKGKAVLVGMDLDTSEGAPVRTEYNVTGFPTLVYFREGQKEFEFGGEHSKDGIIAWMKNPHPPKPLDVEKEWSESENDVVHLTDETFDDVISKAPSALVMFYAPWCGHCKKMKPEYEEAATALKKEDFPGILAAVDATKHTKVGNRFSIKGYPTVKYFKYGKEQFDAHERTKDGMVAFMKDPKEPPPPPPAESLWEETPSFVEHLNGETFKNFIKKKKHCLVIFYAPWCVHCKKAKPEFMAAAEELKDDSRVAFAALDCTRNTQLCQSNGVDGYPTFKYFNYGKNEQKYSGGREKNDFISFMKDPFGTSAPKEPPPMLPSSFWDDVPGHQLITMLGEDNFEAFVQQRGAVLVAFYGATCPHCQIMKKGYAEAAIALKEEKIDVQFGAVDFMSQRTLGDRYGITVLPTIKFFDNGRQHMEYEGPRTKEHFVDLVKKPPPVVVPFADFDSQNVVHVDSQDEMDGLVLAHDRVLTFFYDASKSRSSDVRSVLWSVADKVAGVESGKFAAVDCVARHGLCKKQSLASYPVLRLFVGGKFHSDFDLRSPATEEALISFLAEARPRGSKEEPVKVEL